MAAYEHPVADTASSRGSKCSKSRGQPVRWAGVYLVLAATLAPVAAYESSPRFLFISSPTKRKIYFAPLNSFADLSKDTADRAPANAEVLIDGNPTTTPPPAVPTPAPVADDAEAEVQATYSCSDGNTCAYSAELDGDAAVQEQLKQNSRYHAKDTTISQEECQDACTQATDCTGIEHDTKGNTYCLFWLKNECDVDKGADNAGWKTGTDFTTCSKQLVTTTTPVPTTTTTATVTVAECATCLEQPQGLALWHGKDEAVLYVADALAGRIVQYQITGTLAGSVQAGSQVEVMKDLTNVAGLALDGFGNLFYSTTDGTVGMLSSDKLHPLNTPVSTILYASDSQKTVQNPYALAADNFNVYWTNSANGQQEGVLITGFERNVEELKEKYPDFPKPLAKNMVKAMGVCVAKSNVFFTAEASVLYGVKNNGGAVTEVYKGFENPMGCAYDGDSSLYIADKAGSVYSMPANMPTLRPLKQVQKVVTVEEPASVVVFTRAEAYNVQSQDSGFLGLGW